MIVSFLLVVKAKFTKLLEPTLKFLVSFSFPQISQFLRTISVFSERCLGLDAVRVRLRLHPAWQPSCRPVSEKTVVVNRSSSETL